MLILTFHRCKRLIKLTTSIVHPKKKKELFFLLILDTLPKLNSWYFRNKLTVPLVLEVLFFLVHAYACVEILTLA